MALASINVGAAANDGTGDTLRAAFQKVNANNIQFSAVALSGAYSDLSGSPSLATVATTGAYADLTGKPAAPVATHPGYVVNNWNVPFPAALIAGSALAQNVARFIPFIPPQSITISQLGVRITTAGSSNLQLAIFASDATTKRPTGTPLGSTANIANTAAGAVSANLSPGNVSLTAGTLYWLGINNNDTACTVITAGTGTDYVAWLLGSSTLGNVVAGPPINSLSYTLTFGTWSNLTGVSPNADPTDTKYAMIAFKVASIP